MSDDSVLYNNWTAGKIIGYDACRVADIPALSDYNGFVLHSATSNIIRKMLLPVFAPAMRNNAAV